MSDDVHVAQGEVAVRNKEGLHARPVMQFVDLASKFRSRITVVNITRGDEVLDGKSAMQMMLLEATQRSVLRIRAEGIDARDAVDALVDLIERALSQDSTPPSS